MFANETRMGAPGIPDELLEAAETLVARETAKMRPSGTLNWLQPYQRDGFSRQSANTAVKGAMAPTNRRPQRDIRNEGSAK
ncbi:hypothetical protein GCM10027563_35350 [Parasphingorhabdus pacifica]